MDLNRLNKFVDSASKASSISKSRSSFINEVKNLKEGYQSQLLEAREPITKLEEKRIQSQKKSDDERIKSQKKSDDERQERLITQLKDNQKAIATELRNIKFDQQDLLDELPGTEAIEHPEFKKAPPIPPRPWEKQLQIYDADEEFPNHLELYYENDKGSRIGFPKPSDYLKMSAEDKKKVDKNINNAIKQWNGRSNAKDIERKNIATYLRDNFIKYKEVLDIVTKGQKHLKEKKEKKGKGFRKYKQPKRNAYKIQNSHYGGLLVDYPKLMNNMLLDVYKDNKLVYQDKADRSLIDLLTKRYNPKTKYSINAVRIFNDLNLLANMAKHKSSKKSNMIGSSLVDGSDPNKLAKRLEIIVGSLNAGNNSRILKNDLTLINNELYRIGAITKEMHDSMIKKFLI